MDPFVCYKENEVFWIRLPWSPGDGLIRQTSQHDNCLEFKDFFLWHYDNTYNDFTFKNFSIMTIGKTLSMGFITYNAISNKLF